MIDSANMLMRLNGLVPRGWFRRSAPIRDAIFGGLADSLANIYSLLAAVRLQTRVATAAGWFLDLFAWDFFGSDYLRFRNENDNSWRARIIREIFRERQTRKGITEALVDLTGRTPQIFEPWNTNDCGAIGVGTVAIAGAGLTSSALSGIGIADSGGTTEGHLHLGATLIPSGDTFAGAGCIGSTVLPYQVFITAFRPPGRGVPNIPGIGYGGISDGSTEIIDDSLLVGGISDDEIYSTIARNAAAGVTPWTAIES